MTVVFDSHGFVKRLTAAGMPEPQAEVLAGEHARWFDDGLATKADLSTLAKAAEVELRFKEIETRMREIDARIKESELRLEARVESVKSDILKWMIGMVGFQTIALLGAVVALARALH